MFTWTNKCKQNSSIIMECLDRFLCNPTWLDLYPDSNVMHLPKIHFDYCPIMLDLIKNSAKPSYVFRFETMWLRHPGFQEIVKNSWYDNYNYLNTVNNFSNNANDWNKKTFDNIFKNKKILKSRIQGLENMDPIRKTSYHHNLKISLLMISITFSDKKKTFGSLSQESNGL